MRAVQHTSAPPHLPSDAAARREEQSHYCCLRSGSHRSGQPPNWSGRPLSPTAERAQRTSRCHPATEPSSANLLVLLFRPNEHVDERSIYHESTSKFAHPCDGGGSRDATAFSASPTEPRPLLLTGDVILRTRRSRLIVDPPISSVHHDKMRQQPRSQRTCSPGIIFGNA